jgi:hypothetical protein
MKPRPAYALLACDVFLEELAALAGEDPPWAHAEYLEMGLHDSPDKLRLTLQAAIDRIDPMPGVDAIVLAYGLCGNGLIGLRAGRCPLILPRAHDCVTILLGGAARHASVLDGNPGTYFYSPGWVRGKRVPGPDREAHIRALYAGRYADDPEIIDDLVDADREAFAHHNRAAYVDLTNNTTTEDYCRKCALHLGWEFIRLAGDPGMLQGLLRGDWDAARFLTIPPGHAIAPGGAADLVTATP